MNQEKLTRDWRHYKVSLYGNRDLELLVNLYGIRDLSELPIEKLYDNHSLELLEEKLERKREERELYELNERSEKKELMEEKEMSIIKDSQSANVATNMFSSMFKQVPAVIDLMTGQAAIKTKDNSLAILAFEETPEGAKDYYIEETPFEEFSVTLPGIAIRRTLEQIEIGDIHVFKNGEMGFVVDKVGTAIKVLRTDSKQTTVRQLGTRVLGQKGFLVVSNFTNMLGSSDNMQTMLMMSMMGDTQDPMLKTMLMMNMMKGNSDPGLDPQMMLLMSMMGGKQDMSAMLPFMLMNK